MLEGRGPLANPGLGASFGIPWRAKLQDRRAGPVAGARPATTALRRRSTEGRVLPRTWQKGPPALSQF